MTARSMSVQDAVDRSATVSEVVVGRGAIDGVAAVYKRHFAGRAIVIADDNTWAAAGERVTSLLRSAGVPVTTHVLPGRPRPKPSVELGEELRVLAERENATPVAVGSGVINDLVKYAAFRGERSYLCVATAASMDGYASAGAPLSERGFKKTIACRPAKAIVADLDVIASAPSEMIGWGLGDLAGKIPAGADWILADAFAIEPIDATAWSMVQNDLRQWLARAAQARLGDRAAIEGLFDGLTLVGFAMEAHGTSRPASGADHQIAHLWEMESLERNGERVSHGACVAVGCMAVLQLYDWLLRRGLAGVDPEVRAAKWPGIGVRHQEILSAFGDGDIARRAMAETTSKYIDAAALAQRLAGAIRIWPDLSARLKRQLMTPAEMRDVLSSAGAPITSEDIGVDAARLANTIRNARFLRGRYTVLDFLDEAGLLDAALDELFGRGGAKTAAGAR